MLRGATTLREYKNFLGKGFCKEHSVEFFKNGNATNVTEILKKILLFFRIGILDPILFGRQPFCEKIDFLMKRSNYFSECTVGSDMSDKGSDCIIILDSVVVYTLCHLSKICCIGALFQSKVKIQSEEPEIKFLHNLLHADRFQDTDITQLNPLLKENFPGCDLDLVKVCYVSTLLIVRSKTLQINIKTAVKAADGILASWDMEYFKSKAEVAMGKNDYIEAIAVYTLGLKKNPYCAQLYVERALIYALSLKKMKAAELDFYTSLIFNPSCLTLCQLCNKLFNANTHKELVDVVNFGMALCSTKNCIPCASMDVMKDNFSRVLLDKEVCNGVPKVKPAKDERKKKSSGSTADFPELVEASDSDDESEPKVPVVRRESKNMPELVEASDSDETDTEAFDVPPSLSSTVEQLEELEKRMDTPCGKQMHSKSKKSNTFKQKKLSEGLLSVKDSKGCIDFDVVDQYLKDVSEALIQECGYKALQLFCGPLREVVNNPEAYLFKDDRAICIKYAYGVALCQSGEYDDLQKCIEIFNDIIENYKSTTFPAAYYSLGLAYRKLNRFKEALGYLETVKSILDKGIHCKCYYWPNWYSSGPLIEETKPKLLRRLVEDLMQECENPPIPDAFCRFPDCSFHPTIYYSDPAFRGYVSLSCSDQCCLQYHMQCWKVLRAEKELTDKEFLERPCLTPDCDGVIIKVQSIDRKGDVNKEFIADPKKESKTKWARWEKVDTKEKKKKKRSYKSESQENDFEKEGSESSLESAGKGPIKLSQEKKMPKNIIVPSVPEEVPSVPANSKHSKDMSDAHVRSVPKELPSPEEEASTCDTVPSSNVLVSRCIKNNIYSYMADYLQLHGPLKIDDPQLMDEISNFPDDVVIMIADCGGIGEFLKNDLRFAYVGNRYVCVVADLATAYKMRSTSSLPSDIKSLDSFESAGCCSPYYECDDIQSFGLNPDALEYRPVAKSARDGKNYEYKFKMNKTVSQNTCSRPAASANDVCLDGNTKNLSLEETLRKNVNISKSVLSLHNSNSQSDCNNSNARRKLFDEFKQKQNISNSKQIFNSYFKAERNAEEEDEEGETEASVVGEKLSDMLNIYFRTDMRKHHPVIDTYIKPYIIKEYQDTKNAATVTDMIPPDKDAANIVEALKVENEVLTEQKALLQKQLNSTKQQNQKLSEEMAMFQKQSKDVTLELETLKKEFLQKEEQLQNGRKFLLESLTDAHETIDRQKKEMDALKSERNSLKTELEDEKVALQTAEEKLKSSIASQEKKQASVIQNLHQENVALKCQLQQADLRTVYVKKTEYLKKIEEKSSEATQRRKEFTDGLSMMRGNLNPVLETNMKTLSAQLLTYVNEVAAIKLDFMLKIDDQLEEIKKGASLSELKDIQMDELPRIPCWENLLPANSPFVMGSSQMPFNLGVNTKTPATGLPAPPVAPPITDADHPTAAAVLVKASTVKTAPLMSAPLERNKKQAFVNNSEPLEILNFNPDLQASYKTAMASINSFASAPLSNSAHSLDDDIEKNFAIFRPPTSVSNSGKVEAPKVPPGIPNTVASPVLEFSSKEEKSSVAGAVNTLPKDAMEQQKRKIGMAGKNNYEKLLGKLKEQYPSYSQEELMSYVKEFRAQRQGKLSGLPIDAIISHVGAIINARKNTEKKVSECRNQAKASKVLVNKKLVIDPKPKDTEHQKPATQRKKSAWNMGSDTESKWSGTNSEGSCTICFEDYATVDAYKVQCGHIFHEDCIRQWLQHQTQCPICRLHVLLPEDYPPLL